MQVIEREGAALLEAPRVGLLPVLHAAEAALAAGRGFSLLRLGDGEGAVLAHAEAGMEGEIAYALRVWFGDQPVAPQEVEEMRGALLAAIAGADVLGLPRRAQAAKSPCYAAVFAHAEAALGPRAPLLGDAALHFYLQWSGALMRLVAQAPRITLIGCRPLAGALREHCAVPVRQWLVRGEAQFPGPVAEPHWRVGFTRTMAAIEHVEQGELVLVGAGVLGKAYCEAARARGAVALDIGSVMDSWAGVISRTNRIDGSAHCALGYGQGLALDDAGLLARLRSIVAGTNIADGAL